GLARMLGEHGGDTLTVAQHGRGADVHRRAGSHQEFDDFALAGLCGGLDWSLAPDSNAVYQSWMGHEQFADTGGVAMRVANKFIDQILRRSGAGGHCDSPFQ